jgi:hypothetical protein
MGFKEDASKIEKLGQVQTSRYKIKQQLMKKEIDFETYMRADIALMDRMLELGYTPKNYNIKETHDEYNK